MIYSMCLAAEMKSNILVWVLRVKRTTFRTDHDMLKTCGRSQWQSTKVKSFSSAGPSHPMSIPSFVHIVVGSVSQFFGHFGPIRLLLSV